MKKRSTANQYIYHTQGVCPSEIHFKIHDETIRDLRFVGGGCPGNASLVSRLLEDKPLAEVLSYIEGIVCRNNTSCQQELSSAIQAVQNGTLNAADSFKVREEAVPKRSIALIGDLAGDNEALELILAHIRDCDVDAVLCLGNLTGNSASNHKFLKTIHRHNILAIQGENDWRYSQYREKPDMPKIEPELRNWLLQLPQVLSFKLNDRHSMAFFGDYIQSLDDYSDFAPFALEMNMVCSMTDFMRDDNVFPALKAMIPQFQADVLIFGQIQKWKTWHVDGKDFISVGPAATGTGLTWGLLEENNGQADLKIINVER